MTLRELDGPPGILPLYARAAAPLVPGASLLPFVPGRSKEIPDTELALSGVEVDMEHLASYARVCGFPLRGTLPATYPHVLAFPLHMALMADGSFPFGAIGLVHVANRIVQHRPIAVGEALDLRVRATPLEPHAKGRTFSIVSEARAGDELVWEDVSTMLRRGGGAVDGPKKRARKAVEPPPATATWRLGGDLGRRYGAASGDRNPIHMHALSARLLGFPRAIAHGMWTKARCVAAVDSRLPDAFAVDVAFKAPVLLPTTVTFGSEETTKGLRFAVRSRDGERAHLEGTVEFRKGRKR